jgi:hypothetical protein
VQTAQRTQFQKKEDVVPLAQHADDDDGPVVVPLADTIDEEELEEDDNEIPPELRAHLPASFGSTKAATALEARLLKQQQAQRAVQRRPDDGDAGASGHGPSTAGGEERADDDEDDEDDDTPWMAQDASNGDPWELPISSEVSLKGTGGWASTGTTAGC